MVKVIYKTGDKLVAEVKGYPPWLAKIIKKHNVISYGPKKTPEFVEIENNADDNMQIEEEASEETEKTIEKTTEKIDIVTEQTLKNNILYAEHVKNNISLYKDKPVENRSDSKDQVFAVELPSGTICGVKLHSAWPLEYSNEYDRALYDEQVAKSLLRMKDLLTTENKAPNELDAVIVPEIQMSSEELHELLERRRFESIQKIIDRMEIEDHLKSWDIKIRKNLDDAKPEVALDGLKEFSKIEKDLDGLMFKKNSEFVNTVSRLRTYYSHVKDRTSQDMETFMKTAEEIRNEAEKIYNKIKNIVNIKEEKSTFLDAFMDFRIKCKDLSSTEISFLCAEPDSRQAFLDKLDVEAESEEAESEETAINASNTSEPVLKETSLQG